MNSCRCYVFALVFSAAATLSASQAVSPTATKPQTTAQPPVPAQPPAPPAAPIDPILTAAENLIGKALFLRGFYASNNLTYDPAGRLLTSSAPTGWTLAAINVLKVARPAPDQIELEAVRVAIRYNPDAHEFQRHPLNDEKMSLLIQLAPEAGSPPGPDSTQSPAPDPTHSLHQLNNAIAAIFSIGIYPALQRSAPPLWRHYFDLNLPWPPDSLTGQTIYPIPPLPALPGPPAEIVPPILSHQTASQFTPAALHDKVQGTVQLRTVVDADGIPQRIVVTHPLGYGLDEQAANAVAKWRFNPALHAGKPVPAAILINMDFLPPSPPR